MIVLELCWLLVRSGLLAAFGCLSLSVVRQGTLAGSIVPQWWGTAIHIGGLCACVILVVWAEAVLWEPLREPCGWRRGVHLIGAWCLRLALIALGLVLMYEAKQEARNVGEFVVNMQRQMAIQHQLSGAQVIWLPAPDGRLLSDLEKVVAGRAITAAVVHAGILVVALTLVSIVRAVARRVTR
jgi:hypothetical protein